MSRKSSTTSDAGYQDKDGGSDRATTPTPGEFQPDGSEDEDAAFMNAVRRVFGEFEHSGSNSITVRQLVPLFARLESEQILRLMESSKDTLRTMETASGDLTMSLDDVINLIPQLHVPAEKTEPMQRSASTPQRLQGASDASRPISPRLRTTPLGDMVSSKKMGLEAWKRRTDGTTYDSGSEPEDGYADKQAARRLHTRTPTRIQAYTRNEEIASPVHMRRPSSASHNPQFRNEPVLPTSPLTPQGVGRRPKFTTESMEDLESHFEAYGGEDEPPKVKEDLLDEVSRLTRENSEMRRRMKEHERRANSSMRGHEEDLERMQHKLDEMRSDVTVKRRHIQELKSNERHHLEQIQLLESEVQKHTKNMQILKTNLAQMKKQYEEKCLDEEKLFAQLKAKDEELISSERNLENFVSEHKRSSDERHQLEAALYRLEQDVAFAQELEHQNEQLRDDNDDLKRLIARLRADLEERNHTILMQAESIGRAAAQNGPEATRVRQNLQSEMANYSVDVEEDIGLNDLSTAAMDASFTDRQKVRLLEASLDASASHLDASIAEELRPRKDLRRYVHTLEEQNRRLQQQKERIMADATQLQEDLRRQLRTLESDNDNLNAQIQVLRSRGVSGPAIQSRGVQCDLVLPDTNKDTLAPQAGKSPAEVVHLDSELDVQRDLLDGLMREKSDRGPQWMVTQAGSEVVPSRRRSPMKPGARAPQLDSILSEQSLLHPSELGASAGQPRQDMSRFRVVGLPQVAMVMIGIYLFGLLTAPLFFDPTGGKFGAALRAPLGGDQFVGEAIWALQEPIQPMRPKWVESMLYWLEGFVFGEDLLMVPT
ncbi:hypothetical protein THASP1DRAFT_27330 [Thamnocephalis sphaerospora]|uniref:Uncharacterized protein n=1 Tax=Thamnocephalis sphaerospora TaxID=78915 RepID=A0A4P9XX35_9FUNG|nr:hypothetical protein THASP1DRAFT_27330 [Thamnocephalis sphaerospora]|eukprot:RKP10906.1 hypothetical protein THASP1DRAFT_27330 [Thamnocephalis sphaerospora]